MTDGQSAPARKPSWWDAEPEPVAAAPTEDVSPKLVATDKPEPEPASGSPLDDPGERAAIIAGGAGVPSTWAEGYTALCTMPPPARFRPERWQQIIDAAG